MIQLDILYKKILRTFFAKDNSYGNRRDKYLLNHSIHIYSHLSQQTGNIHAKRSYQLLNIFLRITICTTNHSIVIKQYEIRLDQEIEKIHSLASFPLPLNSKGNELFQQRSPSRAHIPGTTATHPSRRRREERERGGLGRSMITPSYYLDAVELLCPMRLATTPSSASCRSVLRPPLCLPPEDIAEGRRKLLEDRHFRSAHRFVPVIMSSHRFRGWSILPALLLSPA